MKENIQLDFEKYGGTIVSLYQRFYVKRLLLTLIALACLTTGVLLVPLAFMKVVLVLLFAPVIVMSLVRNLQAYRQSQTYLAERAQSWQKQVSDFDPTAEAFQLYEDPDNYYLKLEGEAKRFLKKGSRTLPSFERGLSLIVAENSDIFSTTPLLVHYCDTTELKYLNLAGMHEKLLRQMKLTRLKNKVLPVVFGLILLALLYFYLF